MAHTYTKLLYHIVFSTKERQRLLDATWRERMFEFMGGTLRGLECQSLGIGGVEDHVHVFCAVAPKFAVSDIVQKLKSHSSGWINKSGRVTGRFEWQVGYGAFSVSESNLEKVRKYVLEQERHHKHMTFEDEIRRLLKLHNVEFEEQYLLG
jgi:REP element-mobilizing transposase RayT